MLQNRLFLTQRFQFLSQFPKKKRKRKKKAVHLEHCISVLEFLKDHVTLITGVMALQE